MRNSLLLISFFVLLFTACRNIPPGSNTLLSTKELETTTYNINISEDNTIFSKYGAVINIPAGAIVSDTGMVTIEVTEVYTINDMVKAGLNTQSNGLPLVSCGMIYIGARRSAEVLTTISAYIPTTAKRKNMDVYTGYADNLGNMNWRNPGPLNKYERTGEVNTTQAVDRVVSGQLLSPQNDTLDYYYFSTTALGWYSVGKVTKGQAGFEQSTLDATVSGSGTAQLNVYLVIPSEKIFLAGGPARGKQNTYAFFTDDSKILLPQNKKAYILAMSETDGAVLLGAAEFTTSREQNVEVEVSTSDKEQLARVISLVAE